MKKDVKAPLYKSFCYAFVGIKSALKSERNMMIHFCIMTFVIIMGFIFDITKIEWIICLVMFALVISAELFNTALELIVDMLEPNVNSKAKFCKDVSAGAVLFNAIVAFIVGIIIFFPYLFSIVRF